MRVCGGGWRLEGCLGTIKKGVEKIINTEISMFEKIISILYS